MGCFKESCCFDADVFNGGRHGSVFVGETSVGVGVEGGTLPVDGLFESGAGV